MNSAIRAAVFAAVLVALSVGTGYGQDEPAGGAYKIGVVNLKEVFDSYEKQKAEYKTLETEKDTRQKDIDVLSAKIEKAKGDYDKRKETMPEDERTKLEEQIEADYGVYQADFKRLQQEIDRKERRLIEELFEDIRKAVSEVGAQGNYHLIFDSGESGRSSSVLYYSTTLNMTQRVIDHLNASNKKS